MSKIFLGKVSEFEGQISVPFRVINEKPTGGAKLPPPTKIGLRTKGLLRISDGVCLKTKRLGGKCASKSPRISRCVAERHPVNRKPNLSKAGMVVTHG